MATRTPIYEGKAKQLFEGPEPGTLIQHFKDDATAFNNKKKGTIRGKGVINNRISEYIMENLTDMGIPNHFIKTINMREQLVYALEIIPLEVIVRNVAAGSFTERFGIDEGQPLGLPIVEYCLKNDKLGDPFLSEELIYAFDIAEPIELEEIRMQAMRVNDYVSGLFHGIGIRLIDFKLEFGRHYDEEGRSRILLADEISPDSCRLWDIKTDEKMDKDRFRRDLGDIEEAYQEVAKRLGVLPNADVTTFDTTKEKPAKKAAAKKKPSPKGKKKS